MTSYCCHWYAECLVTTLFQQDSAPAHCAVHMQQLNCCVKKRQTFLRPTCGLQTALISVLWITRSGLSCSIVSTTDKSIVWMNWNGGSLMSGEVLNSQFLTMLLTSGEEDVERVSTFWVQLVNWQFWFCPYLLHSHVTSLTVICLITKSCQQRWPIHSCSFYKVCMH